ncbi:hypothetical protein [Vibrio rotiferianus]|uniref:hypothetical protein n=1 Tax=Vibrio rotiferianus TaxID=190895 RepID=UPI001110A563|nr:hypothetical protein [Vibrio rotiferianus]TMX64549.1 hypothetical protein DA097_12550 [Vibrio rotiferianus]
MAEEKDIYIEVLKYAQTKALEGLSYVEFSEKFGSDKQSIWFSAIKDGLLTYMEKPGVERGRYTSYFVLSYHGKITLLDLQKVEDSKRETSGVTHTNHLAILAIFVSLISMFVSINVSRAELDTPTRIDTEQLKLLVQAIQKSQVVFIDTPTEKGSHKSTNLNLGSNK